MSSFVSTHRPRTREFGELEHLNYIKVSQSFVLDVPREIIRSSSSERRMLISPTADGFKRQRPVLRKPETTLFTQTA